MNNQETLIKFLGFEPTEKVYNRARITIDKLSWAAPSDASLKLELSKPGGFYQVHCRVNSIHGTFTADAASQHATAALKLIENKIQKQINQWKQLRYLDLGKSLLDGFERQQVS